MVNTTAVLISATAKPMNKNDLVQVSANAPHHAGRIGYFQFSGKGPSTGVAVLSEQPCNDESSSHALFAVNQHHLLPVVGFLLMTRDGMFVAEDTGSGGYLSGFDKPYFGPLAKGVFTLDQAQKLVAIWNRSPSYGFVDMTIHPLVLGEVFGG